MGGYDYQEGWFMVVISVLNMPTFFASTLKPFHQGNVLAKLVVWNFIVVVFVAPTYQFMVLRTNTAERP